MLAAQRPGDTYYIPPSVIEESETLAERDHKRRNRMHGAKVAALLRIPFYADEQPKGECPICLDPYNEGEL